MPPPTKRRVYTQRWNNDLKAVRSLAFNMRLDDIREMAMWHGPGMHNAEARMQALLQGCLQSAEVHQFRSSPDDRVLALFGTGPGYEPGSGIIWMLCTHWIDGVHLGVLHAAMKALPRLLEPYTRLIAVSWSGNRVHQRWCKILGFTDSGPLGPEFRVLVKEKDTSKHV